MKASDSSFPYYLFFIFIFRNVMGTIQSLLNGIIIPTHIYLFVSSEPFMYDAGIKRNKIPLELQYLASSTDIFSIVNTNNTGPHRKLLPLLQRHWINDVVIVTFDDDRIYEKDTLFKLINYYIDSNKESVIGLRTRRIGLCALLNNDNINTKNNNNKDKNINISNNNKNSDTIIKNKETTISSKSLIKSMKYDFCFWTIVQNSKKEMLVLPTGNGGILYRPHFFNEIVFNSQLRELTMYNDDITFRLATMTKDVYVVNGCCETIKSCFDNIKDPQQRKIAILQQHEISNIKTDLDKKIANSSNIEMKNKTSSAFNGLYIKNLYRNTDMWLAGLTYLKEKNLFDISKYYNLDYVSVDRPNCFQKREDSTYVIKDKEACGFLTTSCLPYI